jgi:hypothetical protein
MTEAKNGQAKAVRDGKYISANMACENRKTWSNRCPQGQIDRPLEGDVDAWAETARAPVVLKRKGEARTLLESRRERSRVGM